VPRWTPIHPEFLVALRILDAVGLPYAELWRMLGPIAARLDRPRPSYWQVRRIVIEERRRKQARAEHLDNVLRDVIRGVAPFR